MILPNQLTVLRIILTPVFFILFIIDDPVTKQISLGVFIVAALTDWYDGWLARKFNYITAWGKFWDPLADKILTSSAFFGFVILGVIDLWMVIIIVFRDFAITALRSYADHKGHSFPTSYYAKWKTFLQMAFLYYLLIVYTGSISPCIFSGHEELFSLLLNKSFVFYAMLVITVITFHSGATYVINNFGLIKRLFKSEN